MEHHIDDPLQPRGSERGKSPRQGRVGQGRVGLGQVGQGWVGQESLCRDGRTCGGRVGQVKQVGQGRVGQNQNRIGQGRAIRVPKVGFCRGWGSVWIPRLVLFFMACLSVLRGSPCRVFEKAFMGWILIWAKCTGGNRLLCAQGMMLLDQSCWYR